MNEKTKTINAVLQAKKGKAKKLKLILLGGIVGAVLLSYGIYVLMLPRQGSIAFGVCKTFLETHVRYPNNLSLSSVEYYNEGSSIRIWYTQIDSFGEYRFEPIQCYFRSVTENDYIKYGNIPFAIEKITMNKQNVKRHDIEGINKAIVSLISNPPDLTLPSPLPNNLKNLYFTRKPFL